jgi:hypothetical protein
MSKQITTTPPPPNIVPVIRTKEKNERKGKEKDKEGKRFTPQYWFRSVLW